MNLVLKIAILENFRSQSDFAMTCGIKEQAISMIIRGRKTATAQEKETISKMLRVPEDLLFDPRQSNGVKIYCELKTKEACL